MHISLTTLDKYNKFVLKLHGCQEMSSFVEHTMYSLREIIPFENAVFFSVNPETGSFVSPFHIDIAEAAFDLYRDYYEKYDIYRDVVLSSRPVPTVDRCTDYMCFNKWQHNEHRADFLLKNNMYYLAGVQLLYGDALIGEISIHRKIGQENFSDAEMYLLSLLSEHIQAAFSKLRNTESYQEILSILKQAETGLCVFDRTCRCIFASGKADRYFLNMGKALYTKLEELCLKVIESPVMQASYSGTFYAGGALFRFQLITIADKDCNDIYMLCFDGIDSWQPVQQKQNLKLSERETEILRLVAKGYTNKQIADKLYISPETVKTHIKRIFVKTGVVSRTELAVRAIELIYGR